jgi:hypothetical protein
MVLACLMTFIPATGSFAAGEVLAAEPKRPLIFVPGLLGSRLCGQAPSTSVEHVVWGTLGALAEFPTLRLGTDPRGREVRPCGLLREVAIFGRFTQDNDQQILPYGVGWTSGQNFPLTPTIFKQGPARNASLNITSTLSPTMTNEFVFGPSQNKLSLDPSDPNAATYAGLGLNFQTPFPYPADQFFNIEFTGISGLANENIGRINAYSQFPYKNSNTTFDFYDNLSKVWGSHTAKAGIYVQRSRKDQAAGDSARIVFGNDSNNPGNTGYAFANALLGNFDTYNQTTSPLYQGQYRSTNVEFYLQDNWKVNSRLTLDYGMRFNYIGPQYDRRLQDSYFIPELYDPAKAVRLYRGTLVNGQRLAYDPANPGVTLPAFNIGRIVPNYGDPFNGLALAKNGYLKGGIEGRGLQYGPAFGFAYDVFGTQKTVLRGGYRIGYDRVSGNTLIFPAVSNPPATVNPQFRYGNLDTLGSGTVSLAPFNDVYGADPQGFIPGVQSFSLQVQQEIGFDTVVSVAYVGSLSHHLAQQRDLNYIEPNALFLKQNQDPSKFSNGIVPDEDLTIAQVYRDAGFKFDGSKAFNEEFLHRYQGYNRIRYAEHVGSANYHSMQVTAQRRLSRGFTLGLAYTWAKAMGTNNGDNDRNNPICTRCTDYRELAFSRRHVAAINYVWNLPAVSRLIGAENWFTRGLLDNWELSGISQFSTGPPEDVTVSIAGINLAQRINGTYTPELAPRILLTGDTTGERSRASWFDYTQLRLPDIGKGIIGSRNFIQRPGTNVTDLSVYKNFPYGGEGSRFLQLRLEMFNIFNHPQFNDANRNLQFLIDPNFSNYTQNQQASPATIANTRGGSNAPTAPTDRLGRAVGEVNSQPDFVARNRIIQLAIKLYF